MTDIRHILSQELNKPQLAQLDPKTKLLKDGHLSSIEAVLAVGILETNLGTRIPDSVLQPDAFTVENLSLYANGGGSVKTPEQVRGLARLSLAAFQRPLALLGSFVVVFLILGKCTPSLIPNAGYIAFLENGKRFYPQSGALSHYDFRQAMRFHEVNAMDPLKRNVGIFGNSGTFGSYVSAEEAIPHQVQQAMSDGTQVFNMAWFGEPLFKDLMLLELVWEKPWSTIVFTLTEATLKKDANQKWIRQYPHCTYNLELFQRFQERLTDTGLRASRQIERDLVFWDKKHFGAATRLAYSASPLLFYAPYLQNSLFANIPEHLIWKDRNRMRSERVYLQPGVPQHLEVGIEETNIDGDVSALLTATVSLLRQRGVRVLLYIAPQGPAEFTRSFPTHGRSISNIVESIAKETGASVLDASWELNAHDFLDDVAHLTRTANEKIGRLLALKLKQIGRTPGRKFASGKSP